MNQDLSIQGNSFVPVPQKLSSLANPTKFHLSALSKRINTNTNTNNGAPPTPNNSFQSNTLSSNNLPDNTLDPSILQQYHQQQQFMNIKQESAHSEYDDFEVSSPLSNTACNSPHDQGFASPSGNSFEDFGRSFKPPSHLDNMIFGGASTNSLPANSFPTNSFPANSMPANTFYENFPTDNYTNTDDYLYSGEIAMSAPTTSQIGQVDVKANINNQKNNFNRLHNNNNMNNMGNHVSNMSHSLPSEWPYGTSLDSSGYQFANSGEIQNYEGMETNSNDKEAMASEKRRRRRESHNAVERRRRDNINEKIQELSTLLPDLFVDSANKPNKGVILRKSVDYIRHLQHVYEQERSRNSKLESQVRELASKTGNNPGSGSSDNSPGGGNLFGTSMP